MRRVAAGAVRYGMCSAVFVMAFSGTSYADTTASLSSLADQARVEAHKWRADAELVQVELLAFGFGIGPSGYPDVNKTGPPGGALFHFRSPSSQHALRMSADMSRGTLRAVPLSAPVSSYTRGIPADVSLDFDKAIAQAKAAGHRVHRRGSARIALLHCRDGSGPAYGDGRVNAFERHLDQPLWTESSNSAGCFAICRRPNGTVDKDAPDVRPIELPNAGRVVEIPEVGGLHHRYVRFAA